ncbi:MAG: cytochrome-c oxidase, cbb3-type subunit III [Hyphomicrobiales bacterium]|nr:MAG: cytochrome-c oxidase, cbb3-type subunit III [Hyphomicrobiales bacterium]
MAEHKKDIDEFSGVETTGHEWDGLKELNNPLPRWWIMTFYVCIIWAIGYWIAMPSWPLIESYTAGVLGASQRAQAIEAYETAAAARAEKGAGLVEASLEDIQGKQDLLEFAMANGKAAFGDNCAPCHGTGATGSAGFPNLNDDDWLWGGSLEAIHTTIQYGIRSGHDEARVGDMTAFGHDEILEKDQITQVVGYVRSLSGMEAEGADIEAGKTVFVDNCAACHGEDAKGMQELGAPNLTDGIWLYGSDAATLTETVTAGRKGVMPAWTGRLDDVTIKSLAVYVHSLGGGQ